MLYRVYSKYDDNEYTIAICKDREIADAFVELRKKEIEKDQKKFYSIRRAFTFYDVDEILEDDDIKQLLNKNRKTNNEGKIYL